MADKAKDEFMKVLEQDPNDTTALASLASLAYNQAVFASAGQESWQKFDEAAKWYKKLIEVDPKNKEAYYSLGVIAWAKWYPALMTARANLRMKPEDPGPDQGQEGQGRTEERSTPPIIDDGIANLQKALDIDKEYDDAMAYMNLLIRERADLADTPDEYKKQVEIADEWVQKALDTKKAKAAAPARQQRHHGRAGEVSSRQKSSGVSQGRRLASECRFLRSALATTGQLDRSATLEMCRSHSVSRTRLRRNSTELVVRRRSLPDPAAGRTALIASSKPRLRELRPNEDLAPLEKAFRFAAERHKGQKRASGEPYMMHPVLVTRQLADMHMDMTCLETGLLHDVVEDTSATLEEIRKNFGDEVARCVDGVTKLSKLNLASREERQAESVRKMLLAMVDDIRVILVKLADRLHNMRTLGSLPREKQERIAQETIEIYAPIAHRLGMGKIRGELEDLAFQYLEPEASAELLKEFEAARAANEAFLERDQAHRRSAPGARRHSGAREGRVKRAYSVFQKLKRQKITLDQVYDLLAVRIITDSVKNCYAALGVIHNEWHPIPGRIKDFIAIPRPNLYQSLHTSVMGPGGRHFEVQIRTEEMHRIAEEGIAAHWKYKEGKRGPGGGRSAHRLAAPAGGVAAATCAIRASSCPRSKWICTRRKCTRSRRAAK